MAEPTVSRDEGELDRALADLGARLFYPPTPDLASGVLRQLAAEPTRPGPVAGLKGIWHTPVRLQQRLAFAVLVLIALAGAVMAASPEARTILAERLGLPGVQIQQGGPGPALTAVLSPAADLPGGRLSLGLPMTLAQVRERVIYPVHVPSALGAPDEVYLLDSPPGGQVALVYHPRADLPQTNSTGVGLLLTEFQGNVHSTGAVGKGLPPGTRLEEVQVNGGRGFWIDGDPHIFFYLDAGGQVRTETTRLAGSVLLWERGDVTLRLEAALGQDAALKVAASAQ